MHIELGKASELGNRADNEDRAAVHSIGDSAVLVVADGMGGHDQGELAAQAVIDAFLSDFKDGGAEDDPSVFLVSAILHAHRKALDLGRDHEVSLRPRATVAAAVVRDGKAWWAHVGDSRIYLYRGGAVETRTRDHSHVEMLLQSGEITKSEAVLHPMRNLVDRCVGGEWSDPDIESCGPESLRVGDTLLLCSDGFWEPLDDAEVAAALAGDDPLEEILAALTGRAVAIADPQADNSTVAAARFT